MSTRPAAALLAVLILALAAVPLVRADLPCVLPELPCPFQTEGGEVGPGESRTVTGPAKLDEPIAVHGTLVLQAAQMFVSPTLPGLVVHDGGVLRIIGSVIDTQDGEPGAYVIHVLPGGSLELVGSVLRNGQGVIVESSDVTLADSAIVGGGALGVRLVNVTATLTRMTIDALVGVDAVGGDVTVDASRFSNATVAMRFVDANVQAAENVVVASLNGIALQDSTFSLRNNQMDDRADPAGKGVDVMGGSGTISGNTFSKWGTGIEVRDSDVDLLGNSLAGNVVYGILAWNLTSSTIVGNTLQANALVGMLVQVAPGVIVEENVVKDSAFWQVIVTDAPDASIRNNTLTGGVYYAFAAGTSPRIRVEDNVMASTIGHTLHVQEAEDAVIRRNTVAGGSVGIRVVGATAVVEDNVASGSVGAGVSVLSTSGPIDLRRDRSSGGTGAGFDLQGPGITGEDLVAAGHATGFRLDAQGANMTLTRANGSRNTVGFEVVGHGVVTVAALRAFDNGEDGVRVPEAAPVLVMQGAAMGGNAGFAVNATAGLVTPVDARFSWWGDGGGPRHASNPGGIGDAVTDRVDYAPWLTTQPAA